MKLKRFGAAIALASAVFLAPRQTPAFRIARPDIILDIPLPVQGIRQVDQHTLEVFGQRKVFEDRILDYKLTSGTFGEMLVVLTGTEVHRFLADGFVWVRRHRIRNPSCGFIAETGDYIALTERQRRIRVINLGGGHSQREENAARMSAREKCTAQPPNRQAAP